VSPEHAWKVVTAHVPGVVVPEAIEYGSQKNTEDVEVGVGVGPGAGAGPGNVKTVTATVPEHVVAPVDG